MKVLLTSSIEIASPVLDHDTSKLLKYLALLCHFKFKEAWNLPAANEFGMLAQGIKGRVKPTNAIFFIRLICQVHTEKKEPNQTHATLEGNIVNYPHDVGTRTADVLLIKIFLTSVISTPEE